MTKSPVEENDWPPFVLDRSNHKAISVLMAHINARSDDALRDADHTLACQK